MCQIANNSIISWTATKGTEPYVEEYLLTINVRTYDSPDTVINQCIVKIILPLQYPNVAPLVTMENPVIFHPNWWTNGRWSSGCYNPTESLGNFVKRMVKSIQFNSEHVAPYDSCNKAATKWYLENIHLFPSDTQELPDIVHGNISFRRIK